MGLEYSLHLIEKIDAQQLISLADADVETSVSLSGALHADIPYANGIFNVHAWTVTMPLAPPSETLYLHTFGAIPQTQMSFITGWENAHSARRAILRIVLRILEIVPGDAFLMHLADELLLSRKLDQLTFKWGYWSLDELTTLKLRDAALEK